ncbi:MAG: CoB--CoM heterodisulfide reductase iron-sulfur subunit A family protein [Desulfobacterales bacterium]|nr:CoB--CoM heterodisulfide reductase iron-sulfur subunit A family protein [Desulfobacterales bacterium]MBL7173190.1 CoB--CoM heterodisulfide reductase iron-sulfur subunit A family protein [Desulfobacteraceae bacterium]
MAEENKEKTETPEEKVGVYVCHCGGNISDHVDVKRVCENAKNIPGVVKVQDNVFMCSDPGQELIMEDLKSGAVNRVVVASCAPDLHETTFRNAITRAGGNPYIYEHANIREQVSWVHHGDQATNKATRLVAAAVAKARELKPLKPFRVDAKKHVTVIGGGAAGLKAAVDLAARGMEVALLEKSPFLGGWTAKWDRLFPTDEQACDILSELTGKVLNHPSIAVYNCSLVKGFEGYIGNFKLHVKREAPGLGAYDSEIKKMSEAGKGLGEFIPFVGVCPKSIPEAEEEFTIGTGVIVLATGFKPYTPRRGEYGYGDYAEVITLKELIPVIAENRENGAKATLEISGRKIRNMAMIHCVGSRQIPGVHEADSSGNLNQYCSRTCCSATLHAANEIREAHPQTRVFDFYRDIRTYGRGHEELYERASRNKVLFFRFEAEDAPVVSRNKGTGNSPLSVRVKDVLTFDEEIEVPVDLVVLASGMEPNDVSDLVKMMKLPVGVDRFLLEVHPKLRPVEMAVSGVLLAGTSQAPFDIGEACAAASAAAVKASAILGRGYVELDPFVAEVDLDKCTGCGACLEACVHDGVLSLVEMEVNGVKGLLRAQVNPALCTGGGICVGVCPENAIDINGWTLKQYEEMVDMIVSDKIL